MKFSDLPSEATAEPAGTRKPLKLADIWDQAKGPSADTQEGSGGSFLGALWEGLQRGAASVSVPELPLTPGAQANREKVRGAMTEMANRPPSPQMQNFPAARWLGEIGGNMAATGPLGAVGRAATIPARIGMGALTGGAMGAAQPGSLRDRAIGGGLGAVTGGAAGGLGAAMGPPLSAAAQSAIGQFPHIAGLIRGTTLRTPDNFNRAAANTALSPIGVTVSPQVKAGHKLIETVEDHLTDAYNAVLPNLSLKGDVQLAQELSRLKNYTGTMSREANDQLQTFIKSHIENYFSPGKPLDGKQIKLIMSQAGRTASANMRGGPNEQAVADAIYQAREAVMDAVIRQNPTYGPALQKVDEAYANFTRLRAAAARNVDSAGVFTPHDLRAAAKTEDRSVGKGRFAKGHALMQAVSEAAEGPMAAPKVNKLLAAIVGGGLGLHAGGPLGGGIGSAAGGLLMPEIAKLGKGATHNPVGRTLGTGVSAAAPAAGATAGRRSYLRYDTEPPP